MPVIPELQAQGRTVWGAGHWDQVADYVSEIGPKLLDAVGVEEGVTLLDVGTGSGSSVAIPAAQRGAKVVGSDLVASHFDDARKRADAAGVEVEWVEADALDLPFEDGTFDRVCSALGHMFAPDHQLAADELVRVCKPGGVIGFACWTPEGIIGQMFRTTASHMPPPPPGVQPPPLWGNEVHVRELFAPHGLEPEFERLFNVFREPGGFEAYNERFESNFGPMVMARNALGDGFAQLQAQVYELYEQHNKASDGSVEIEGEYLQTIIRKPS